MQTRTGLKKNTSDHIKFYVEQKVKSLGLDSLPKVSDISLRKEYVRITLKNIDDCNISSVQSLFPRSKMYLKQVENEAKLEMFIQTRTLTDYFIILLIGVSSTILIARSYFILIRLLKS